MTRYDWLYVPLVVLDTTAPHWVRSRVNATNARLNYRAWFYDLCGYLPGKQTHLEVIASEPGWYGKEAA